ncbi:Ig-like domain-containing protein, partial [Motilimonas pumila]
QTGDIVTLTVNGKTFTGPVDVDGNFSINVPGSDLAADPDATIYASLVATNAIGGSATVTDTEGYSVDTDMTNTAIALDENITADDIINAAEAAQQIPVTGKASGDFQTGDTVTLTVNGKTFTGPVDVNGNFSINVPGADLAADPDTTIEASLAATDAAGNSTTVTDTEGYSVDTEMTNTAITLDENITADDIINAAEAAQQIPVTGKASGDFQTGDTVTLTVNGKTFTGPVGADGNFSINIPGVDLAADPDTTIEASLAATDAAGNTATVTDSEGYSLDLSVNAVINLDTEITADDIINAAEQSQSISVTGKASGDFQTGDIVTLTVNGKTFTGPVDVDGNFSINVPGSDLAADPDATIEASLVATNAIGGSATVTDTEGYSVDTDMTNTAITLDENITADDIINAAEAGLQIPVTGKASGDFQTGDTVTLTVNGKIFTGPVDVDGNFSINVPGADLVADSDKVIDASLAATDAAGNSTTVTDTEGYSVDTEMTNTAITLDENITADDIINAAEAAQQIPVTGKASGDFQTGDTVTLTVNGKIFTGPVDADGNFSINVPGVDLAADPDTTIEASLAATDAAGNTAIVTDSEGYSLDLSVNAAINLDTEITA